MLLLIAASVKATSAFACLTSMDSMDLYCAALSERICSCIGSLGFSCALTLASRMAVMTSFRSAPRLVIPGFMDPGCASCFTVRSSDLSFNW